MLVSGRVVGIKIAISQVKGGNICISSSQMILYFIKTSCKVMHCTYVLRADKMDTLDLTNHVCQHILVSTPKIINTHFPPSSPSNQHVISWQNMTAWQQLLGCPLPELCRCNLHSFFSLERLTQFFKCHKSNSIRNLFGSIWKQSFC